MDETWRIVLADGRVLDVAVSGGPGDGGWWDASLGGPDAGTAPTQRRAISVLCDDDGLDVCEILAPGELTRAEAVAAARAEAWEAAAKVADTEREGHMVDAANAATEPAMASHCEAADMAGAIAHAIRTAAKGGVQ